MIQVSPYRGKARLSLFPSPPLPCSHIAQATTGPEHGYLLSICHHAGEQHREHDWLHWLLFCSLCCVVLVIDGTLAFLDFSIMQGGIIRMIILHGHVAQPCLYSCMSDHHTSSNVPGARKCTVLEQRTVSSASCKCALSGLWHKRTVWHTVYWSRWLKTMPLFLFTESRNISKNSGSQCLASKGSKI